MASASPSQAAAIVVIGRDAGVLDAVGRPGVELTVWRRDPDPAWAAWLGSLPLDAWPACRLALAPEDAATALAACFEARDMPCGPERTSLVADVARLVARFAALARTARVQLRMEAIIGDGCRRWHRDCVPLRPICTYRGPGTQWVPPELGDDVLCRPDDDTMQALPLGAADVGVFKGCGWPGQTHDGGIVHRAPRIAGTGTVRLVLVLDAVRSSPEERVS